MKFLEWWHLEDSYRVFFTSSTWLALSLISILAFWNHPNMLLCNILTPSSLLYLNYKVITAVLWLRVLMGPRLSVHVFHMHSIRMLTAIITGKETAPGCRAAFGPRWQGWKWKSWDPNWRRQNSKSSLLSAVSHAFTLKWKIMIILKIALMSCFWHSNYCQKLYFIYDSVLASLLLFQQYALLLSKEHTACCYLQFWDCLSLENFHPKNLPATDCLSLPCFLHLGVPPRLASDMSPEDSANLQWKINESLID